MSDRINLNMSVMDMFVAMGDGNPGAMVALLEVYNKGGEVDPQSFAPGVAPILSMDSHRIYGDRIWMFYKDLCGKDVGLVLAMLRAVQLGFLPESELNDAIDGEVTLDIPDLLARVKERLPEFNESA